MRERALEGEEGRLEERRGDWKKGGDVGRDGGSIKRGFSRG